MLSSSSGQMCSSVQKNGMPRKYPRNSGGAPSGVRHPPMLATRKMKKTTMWALCARQMLARRTGRMSSIAAPVVPIQLARNVPIASMITLLRVEPLMVPATWMPPVTTNRPSSSTMKGM